MAPYKHFARIVAPLCGSMVLSHIPYPTSHISPLPHPIFWIQEVDSICSYENKHGEITNGFVLLVWAKEEIEHGDARCDWYNQQQKSIIIHNKLPGWQTHFAVLGSESEVTLRVLLGAYQCAATLTAKFSTKPRGLTLYGLVCVRFGRVHWPQVFSEADKLPLGS
jgi:hypothetical protein